MDSMKKKSLDQADEVRLFDKGKIDLVTLGGVLFGRSRFEPGWKWSTCVKSLVNTESCEAAHLQYHIAGRMGVRMNDGSCEEFGPGDIALLPPGHDAWVIGDEAVEVLDVSGALHYAKPYYPEAKKPEGKKNKKKIEKSSELEALLNKLDEIDAAKRAKFDEIDPNDVGVELLQEKHEIQSRRHELVKKINALSIEQTGEPYFESYYASE